MSATADRHHSVSLETFFMDWDQLESLLLPPSPSTGAGPAAAWILPGKVKPLPGAEPYRSGGRCIQGKK